MNTQKTFSKVFDVLSFIAIITAAVFYVVYKNEAGTANFWILLMIVFAIFFRMIGMQFKYNALKKENQILKKDLKNLTTILEKNIENKQ